MTGKDEWIKKINDHAGIGIFELMDIAESDDASVLQTFFPEDKLPDDVLFPEIKAGVIKLLLNYKDSLDTALDPSVDRDDDDIKKDTERFNKIVHSNGTSQPTNENTDLDDSILEAFLKKPTETQKKDIHRKYMLALIKAGADKEQVTDILFENLKIIASAAAEKKKERITNAKSNLDIFREKRLAMDDAIKKMMALYKSFSGSADEDTIKNMLAIIQNYTILLKALSENETTYTKWLEDYTNAELSIDDTDIKIVLGTTKTEGSNFEKIVRFLTMERALNSSLSGKPTDTKTYGLGTQPYFFYEDLLYFTSLDPLKDSTKIKEWLATMSSQSHWAPLEEELEAFRIQGKSIVFKGADENIEILLERKQTRRDAADKALGQLSKKIGEIESTSGLLRGLAEKADSQDRVKLSVIADNLDLVSREIQNKILSFRQTIEGFTEISSTHDEKPSEDPSASERESASQFLQTENDIRTLNNTLDRYLKEMKTYASSGKLNQDSIEWLNKKSDYDYWMLLEKLLNTILKPGEEITLKDAAAPPNESSEDRKKRIALKQIKYMDIPEDEKILAEKLEKEQQIKPFFEKNATGEWEFDDIDDETSLHLAKKGDYSGEESDTQINEEIQTRVNKLIKEAEALSEEATHKLATLSNEEARNILGKQIETLRICLVGFIKNRHEEGEKFDPACHALRDSMVLLKTFLALPETELKNLYRAQQPKPMSTEQPALKNMTSDSLIPSQLLETSQWTVTLKQQTTPLKEDALKKFIKDTTGIDGKIILQATTPAPGGAPGTLEDNTTVFCCSIQPKITSPKTDRKFRQPPSITVVGVTNGPTTRVFADPAKLSALKNDLDAMLMLVAALVEKHIKLKGIPDSLNPLHITPKPSLPDEMLAMISAYCQTKTPPVLFEILPGVTGTASRQPDPERVETMAEHIRSRLGEDPSLVLSFNA